MHTIYLKAVDSREATDEELEVAQITPEQIPPGWKIMAHQAATVRVLRFSDAPIIVNQALTGDGKTLAGQFRLFADGIKTLTMYPTNELAADQKRGLDDLLGRWTPPRWTRPKLKPELLDAAKLDVLQDALETMTRPDLLKTQLENEALLTNPDMFHLMMQFGYRRYGAAHDLILGEVANRFSLFVFDEFHLFGAAQTASAMIAILLMLQITAEAKPPRRFLFLSATPQGLLAHLAGLIGLKVERIAGEYQHGLVTPPNGWRRILRPTTLHLDTGKLDTWVAGHLDNVILPFFAQYRPGAKGVIIANSVATAYRVLAILTEPCDKARIKLGINTGLTSRELRVTDVDLLVATSTIDVGVDFKINLLIFESIDANSHIQRLGRLGRHTHDGKGSEFSHFEAYALLPAWVAEALAVKFPDGSTTDRDTYRKTIEQEDVYPSLQNFEPYVRQWAGVQAAHVLGQLGKSEIKTQYQAIWELLFKQYKTLFPKGNWRYRQLAKDKQLEILDEAISFRGGSPFMALVIDMTGQSRVVMSYNLMSLLLNGNLESVELSALLNQAGKSRKALERSNPIAAYRLHGWLTDTQPRSIQVYVDRDLDVTQFDEVIEQDGFRLDVQGMDMNAVNDRLEQRTLVALLLRNQDPEAIRRRLRLGFQIDLFKFRSVDGSQGCAVFARDALLLDSILFRFRKSNDNRPLIF